ncbi:MAG: hypothetical protein Q8S33_23200 [Myxococcales bacterium]|nr:hypothetical protein [Myxococcales bacterium]
MGRVLVLLLLGGSTTSAAASSVLVVGENERGREVASELSEVFAKQKVKMKVAGPQAPATSCLFRPASERGRCFSQAGQTAFVDAVLQVGATTAKGRTTVTFQLLSLDDGRVIKREVATGPSNNLSKALAPVVSRLAKLIKPQGGGSKAPEKVEPEKTAPEPVVTAPEPVKTTPVQTQPDVPKKTVLEPVVVAPPPSIVAPVEPKGSGLTVAAWTTTGLAVAAAGVAGTFGVLGLNARGELDTNEGGVSALSRSQANALAGQANTNFTVALGAGIGAGVLGVVSAILWSQTP